MPSPIDGLLILDKPSGPTSHQACARVARAIGAAKAGHGGTLDPAATGVLVLCLGRATKLFDALQQGTKTYEATVSLGRTTDTLDATGRTLAERPVPALDAARIEAALAPLRGEIQQTPPMFSALKRGGKPLHRLARAGVEVAREPRRVTIHRLERLDHDERSIRLRIVCSKGTYIRVLAADLGDALGCGAHLAALRRTASGVFGIEDAMAMDEVIADPAAARARVLPLDEARRRLAGAETPEEPGRATEPPGRAAPPRGHGCGEAWVHVPGPSELGHAAREALARLEARGEDGAPLVAAHAQSLNEAALLANLHFDRAVLDHPGETSPREREMIALVVSARNRCAADTRRHRRRLAAVLEDPAGEVARERWLDRLEDDWRRAPLSDRERAMLAYADRLARDCSSMDPSLVEELRRRGLSDTAITEVAMVAAYVAFENRVTLGLGAGAETAGVESATPGGRSTPGEKGP